MLGIVYHLGEEGVGHSLVIRELDDRHAMNVILFYAQSSSRTALDGELC